MALFGLTLRFFFLHSFRAMWEAKEIDVKGHWATAKLMAKLKLKADLTAFEKVMVVLYDRNKQTQN